MTRPPNTKPRKQTASQALVTALANQTREMHQLTQMVKALVRENQRLVDVLLSDAGVTDDGDAGDESETYLDGSRRQ